MNNTKKSSEVGEKKSNHVKKSKALKLLRSKRFSAKALTTYL
jgi:hypothetical protein